MVEWCGVDGNVGGIKLDLCKCVLDGRHRLGESKFPYCISLAICHYNKFVLISCPPTLPCHQIYIANIRLEVRSPKALVPFKPSDVPEKSRNGDHAVIARTIGSKDYRIHWVWGHQSKRSLQIQLAADSPANLIVQIFIETV